MYFSENQKREDVNIPPGIYRISSKRGIISYRVRIRMQGHPPVSKNFKNLTVAKKWKRLSEAEIEKGEYLFSIQNQSHTLSEAIDKYEKELLSARKVKDAKDMKRHLDRWLKELGKIKLTRITPQQIAAVRDKLSNEKTVRNKTRNPATVIRYLATLSHLFSVAVKDWGWIKDNPVFKVRRPKKPSGRNRYLDKNEIKFLLSECQKSENPYLFAIVSIALQTGMRRGEITSLKWEDVDFVNKCAQLSETKNGTPRTVPLNENLMQIIENQQKEREKSLFLFPSPHDPEKPIDFQSAWKLVLKKTNIKDFVFHDLRHTAASYLGMAGYAYEQVGEILGHKSVGMTKRYIHFDLEARRQMTKVLGELCCQKKH